MYNSSEDIHLLLQPDLCKADAGLFNSRKGANKPRAKTAPNRPAENQADAAKFLKKNQRIRAPPLIDRKEYQCMLHSRRPPIPKSGGQQPVRERTVKNFVQKNVQATSQMEAKPHAPIIVVSCRGDRRDLTRFLEARQLRERETFGKVPKYLTARRKCWEEDGVKRKQVMEEMKKNEENPMRSYKQVSQEERQTLLQGLKERWTEVHKEFLRLPVLCDTAPKVKRKLGLERNLASLEKDIELLETNPYIFLDGPATKNF